MFTSCSPGWIKFVEHFYPEFLPNLSTCKSPQQMMGAVIKSFWAQRERPGPARHRQRVDHALHGQEVRVQPRRDGPGLRARRGLRAHHPGTGRAVPDHGVNPATLEPEGADSPFGERSSAGKLFGASGGVMEAAVCAAPTSCSPARR